MELMNCKGMFSQDCIDEIKNDINGYHQGFTIVNDELYIPKYKVHSLGLKYDDDTECIVLDDYNKATAKDKLASMFNDNDLVSNAELIDFAEAVWTNDIDSAYQLMLKVCHDNYCRGFMVGFNTEA